MYLPHAAELGNRWTNGIPSAVLKQTDLKPNAFDNELYGASSP
jgi:hypothetical protein